MFNVFNKYLTLILLIIAANNTMNAKITVNGKDLDSIVKSGRCLVYTTPNNAKTNNNIYISIKGNDITITSYKLGKDIAKLRKVFENLNARKHLMTTLRVGETWTSKSNNINFGSVNATAKNIYLKAQELLQIIGSILEAEKVTLIGKDMEFTEAFINTKQLQIESATPSSLLDAILFTFNKELNVPCSIQGTLHFTDHGMEGELLIIGAQEMVLQFAPYVFENKI